LALQLLSTAMAVLIPCLIKNVGALASSRIPASAGAVVAEDEAASAATVSYISPGIFSGSLFCRFFAPWRPCSASLSWSPIKSRSKMAVDLLAIRESPEMDDEGETPTVDIVQAVSTVEGI
jgi:hypothetical protein